MAHDHSVLLVPPPACRDVRTCGEACGQNENVPDRGRSRKGQNDRVPGRQDLGGRVLRNLGDNAARHAAGRVRLALGAAGGWALLHVDDDGPGVPQADRTRVFDRFVRLDEARGRVGGGSGLGLALVAELVAVSGGTVSVEDAPLGGARVTVRT